MKSLLIALVAACLIVTAMAAPEAPGILIRSQRTPEVTLRGFGPIAANGWLWQTERGHLSRVDFVCQTPAAAQVVASKYLADLLGYGAVSKAESIDGVPGTALEVRHGGSWLIAWHGQVATVVSGPDRAALGAFATDAAEWQPVGEGAYPRFLDNFDNASLALWWMCTTKTDEQLAWTESMPVAVNLHSQTFEMTPAAGVVDLASTDNALAQFRQMGKPYRHMLWMGKTPWRNPFMMPGHRLEELPDGYVGDSIFRALGYKVEQLASQDVHTIFKATMVETMRARVDDPDLMAWMEPHGEFHLMDPQPDPPGYLTRFPAYLQIVKKYTLPSLSETYTGDRAAYQTWRDVEYPSTAWFYGRRGEVVDLDDIPWRWELGSLADGEANGWQAPDFDDSAWRSNLRTDSVMLSNWQKKELGLWHRFNHKVPASLLANRATHPVYLHISPYTESEGRPLAVWINGQEVARNLFSGESNINKHSQVDVSAVLKPGDNQIVIYSNGGRIAYRVFLSNTAGENFPFSDPRLNQRYLDWRDYYIWEKLQTLTEFLTVMRSVDPVRPIKVMTPHLFQTEAFELFERFGAYPQLTGEGGGWYRPMHYKGYSRLYGIPGSSEPGGASKDARSSQALFSNIFWESQDAHDYVFDLSRELWSHPEARAWWSNHKALLSTLGKTDFVAPQLGLLRDVEQSSRYLRSEIWNWDMSRGPLPALGLTPVLVDGGGMLKGRADAVPVMLDCATTVMEPEMVDSIHRYVRGGGTFIAQHHTGQHTPQGRDAWPLAASFGLEITKRFADDASIHSLPTMPIHFTEEQSLFPSLRGKSAEGSGVAIDYMDNQYTGSIAIRSDGSNVTPIATWEDGSMAIVEVREGNGRFILLGTPFYLRFKDSMGKWFNEAERQKLLEGLLAGVGVTRETYVTDPRIWFERRASKNGLYDVYFAGAMGNRNKEWTFNDTIAATLTARGVAADVAVDPTQDGTPDIPLSKGTDGTASFGQQDFEPYQIRQFAVVRDDAGFDGPLHWLGVQSRTWRALEPVSSAVADAVVREAAKIAGEMGETGLNLNTGWRVDVDPEPTADDDTAWITATPAADARMADLGAWRTQGFTDATHVRYRKRIALDPSWIADGRRLILGMDGYLHFGLMDKGDLWLNGKQLLKDHRGNFTLDITQLAHDADGVLDLAISVRSDQLTRGPIGTLYLRGMPAATVTAEPTALREITDWSRRGEALSLPIKQRLFGIEASFDIPAEWAGRTVRLVVQTGKPGRQLGGCIVNETGLFQSEDWAPIGPQIDKWLKPGETNHVELYSTSFRNGTTYDGFNADIVRIVLEVSP